MSLEQQIAARILELIKRKGVTKLQLAELCKVQPSIVTRWISGKHNFTLKTICMIEARLGESIISIPVKKQWVSVKYVYVGRHITEFTSVA